MAKKSVKQIRAEKGGDDGGRYQPAAIHRILVMLAASLPIWHTQTAREMLYPLFSSAPTRALSASVPATAIMLLLLVAISTRKTARSLSWRTLWLIIGAWKTLSDPLIVKFGGNLMQRGLGPGVVFGRILVDAVPNVATWIWILNSFHCKEVRRISDFFQRFGMRGR